MKALRLTLAFILIIIAIIAILYILGMITAESAQDMGSKSISVVFIIGLLFAILGKVLGKK